MVWDPARITPKPWGAIAHGYRHIEDRNHDFQPLRRLAEHVASARYAPSLFGATSGTALLVARAADADWTRDALRVDVGLGGSIRLVRPQKDQAKSATSECDGEKIVEAFEAFLREAGWVGPL
jgi:hypothetical protein